MAAGKNLPLMGVTGGNNPYDLLTTTKSPP